MENESFFDGYNKNDNGVIMMYDSSLVETKRPQFC